MAKKKPGKKRAKRRTKRATPAPGPGPQLVEPYWKGVQVQRGTVRAAVPRRKIQD